MPLEDAVGRVLAAPIEAAVPLPPHAIALRDGWAVAASDVLGASSYSPVMAKPPWIETGEPLPPGLDAVLPPDGFSMQGAMPEIVAEAAPGDGVRHMGGDATAGTVLRRAGEPVRPMDAALARAAGVDRVQVREARVRILSLPGAPRDEGTGALVSRLLGAVVERAAAAGRDAVRIGAALTSGAADLVVLVGGTGFGHEDYAAEALAASGFLIAHGIALRPGETAGCGLVGEVPVILAPGRLEMAFATTLALTLPCLAHLTGALPPLSSLSGPLTRKVSSAVGMTDIVLLRRTGQGLEPLAVGDLTLAAIAHAEAWLAVPAESEGFAAGDTVAVFLL